MFLFLVTIFKCHFNPKYIVGVMETLVQTLDSGVQLPEGNAAIRVESLPFGKDEARAKSHWHCYQQVVK